MPIPICGGFSLSLRIPLCLLFLFTFIFLPLEGTEQTPNLIHSNQPTKEQFVNSPLNHRSGHQRRSKSRHHHQPSHGNPNQQNHDRWTPTESRVPSSSNQYSKETTSTRQTHSNLRDYQKRFNNSQGQSLRNGNGAKSFHKVGTPNTLLEQSGRRHNVSQQRRNGNQSYWASFLASRFGAGWPFDGTGTSQKSNFSQRPKMSRLKGKRPNILLVLTDDLDVELGSLNYMPRLRSLLGDAGALLTNAYTTTPKCCPSRSSILTGMYIHNHEVYTNNMNCSSIQWQNTHEKRTFASYIEKAGYRTGYFGKYLNKYSGHHIPPGWNEWAGLVRNSKYYNYTINRNSKIVKYGSRYPQDYYPHVITNDGLNFIKEESTDPFLLVVSYPSPHGPEDSAPEHAHKFFNASDHHTPSYNYAPNPDKQWILQKLGRMPAIIEKFTDVLMTKRLQTLQTVDEGLEKLILRLKSTGELDNTYVFFTSDHGYHLGQFGIGKGKSMPFEFDIKVPFYVRGPGIGSGVKIPNIALNVDLAPTFLDIAGVKVPDHMDGRSLLPFLKGDHEGKWRDSFLVESCGRHREEADFDRKQEQAYIRANGRDKMLKAVTSALGEEAFKNVSLYTSKHERFEEVCAQPEFASPCNSTQKWHCVKHVDRWRIKKCRPHPSVWLRHCLCQFQNGFGSYGKLDPRERRKQRRFIKKHVNRDISSLGPKFLGSFNNVEPHFTISNTHLKNRKRRKHGHKRYRRSNNQHIKDAFFKDALSSEQLSVRPEFSDVFLEPTVQLNLDDQILTDQTSQAFVAEEELKDLEDQIFDITDELNSLESVTIIQNQNSTSNTSIVDGLSDADRCQANGANINCEKEVYEDLSLWRMSKAAIEDKMRMLRRQLALMKNIHRHLRKKRPQKDDFFEIYDNEISPNESNHKETNMFFPSLDYQEPSLKSFENPFISVNGKNLEDYNGHVLTNEDGKLNLNVPEATHAHRPTGEDFDLSTGRFFDVDERPNKRNLALKTGKIFNRKGYKNLDETLHSESDITKGQYQQKKNVDLNGSIKHNYHNKNWNRNLPRNPGRLYPVPMSYLLDNAILMKNEAFQPTCWCDGRIVRRLQIEQARIHRREMRQNLKQKRQGRRPNKVNNRKIKHRNAECDSITRSSCYVHDNDHWRTPPLWTDGTFCMCLNAPNDTYWCLRSVNETQNFLYCEFITGLITYYDLHIDPYQLRNVAFTLSNSRVFNLHSQLEHLRVCKGADDCEMINKPKALPVLKNEFTVNHKISPIISSQFDEFSALEGINESSLFHLPDIGEVNLKKKIKIQERDKRRRAARARNKWKKRKYDAIRLENESESNHVRFARKSYVRESEKKRQRRQRKRKLKKLRRKLKKWNKSHEN